MSVAQTQKGPHRSGLSPMTFPKVPLNGLPIAFLILSTTSSVSTSKYCCQNTSEKIQDVVLRLAPPFSVSLFTAVISGGLSWSAVPGAESAPAPSSDFFSSDGASSGARRWLEPARDEDFDEDGSRLGSASGLDRGGFDGGGRAPNPVSSSSRKGLDMVTSDRRVASALVGVHFF